MSHSLLERGITILEMELAGVADAGLEVDTTPVRLARFLVFMSSVTFRRPPVTPEPCKPRSRPNQQFLQCRGTTLSSHVWRITRKVDMIGIGNDVPKLQSVSATCLFISENTPLIPTPVLPAFLAPVPVAFSLKSEPAGGGGGGGGPPPGGLGAA